MPNVRLSLSEVKNVPYFGRSFPFIPWSFSTKLRVSWVFARRLASELGALRFLAFWALLPFRLVPLLQKNGAGLKVMAARFGRMAGLEWMLLLLIYRDIEKRSDKESAYRFAKEAIQECSLFMMPEFYQVEHLARFVDPFEAFWAYHKAMFADDPNYENEFIEDGDVRMMVVHNCRNCQIAQMTIPELAPLGCDHDITGYAAIEAPMHMQFRRPKTLAKDGEPCRFTFYRAGTAPTDGSENH